MGTFCRGIAALAVLTGVVAIRAPAVADGGPGPAYFDQPYLPSIWQGLYGGVHLGWGWSGAADGSVAGVRSGTNCKRRGTVLALRAMFRLRTSGVQGTFLVFSMAS